MNTTVTNLPLLLLPDTPGLQVEQVRIDNQTLHLDVTSTEPASRCPLCQNKTSSLHSHYRRTFADLPWGTYGVQVHALVRRFRCRVPTCPRRVFTERLATLMQPWARRTARAQEWIQLVGMAAGGEGGSRLLGRHGLPASAATVLRLIRCMAAPTAPAPVVIGVDDFALRRGRIYGTIIVDLARHRPIDLLEGRAAATLIAWLQAHPSIEVISRDRSTEYARGATEGAPGAVQVADRWHILKNLRDALERILDRHRSLIEHLALPPLDAPARRTAVEAVSPTGLFPPQRSVGETAAQQGRRLHRLVRYQQVQALHAQGESIRAIAAQLGIARGTVRRFIHAMGFPERAQPRRAASILDPYLPYLERRWQEGCQNALQLWRELQAQGYTGSRKPLAIWARQRRARPAPTTPTKYLPTGAAAAARALPARTARPPASRRLVWLLLLPPEALTEDERQATGQLTAASPLLQRAYELAQAFVHMVRDHAPDALAPWLAAARASGVSDLVTFAAGLEQDRAAILAALSLPWSQGQVEGFVNKLKTLKRQMYGRAKLDLLRQRVLHAA
jgi:transposase